MQPVLKRGGMFWDRDLLPVEAYRERYRRMQTAIAEAGDDAWLVFGDVERHGALTYVSNFFPRVRSAVALLPRQGEPTLLVSMGLRDIPACKQITWIDDVRPFLQLPKPLIALFEERGLALGKVGLIGADEAMPITDWEAIAAGAPGVTWSPRAEGLSRLRQSKDAFELAAIRRTASAVENAFDEAPRLLRPDLSLREVAAELDRMIRRAGAEDVRILVAGGRQTGVALRPADDRQLAAGDPVMLFIAAQVQRYWAEAARTFVLGPPSPALHKLAERVRAAVDGMRAAAVSGTAVGELARFATEALGEAAPSAQRYSLGHGIGLDEEEAPMIAAGSDARLAPDSTLALHVIAHADGYGVALGQTVLARDGHSEALNDAPLLIECRPG